MFTRVLRRCVASTVSVLKLFSSFTDYIAQELCESRGGRPGLSVLTNLLASVDVRKDLSNHASALVSACP